jgi:hypothetical protein
MKNYLGEIELAEKKLLLLKNKQKDLVKLIKSTNKNDFNRKEPFKYGDIVLFNGFELIIAVIGERHDINGRLGYVIDGNMHFSHSVIREATKDEVKMLGDKKTLILKKLK